MTSLISFLEALLSASEKSAELARLLHPMHGIVSSDPSISLSEEKVDECKNKGFDVDFKTLADVLIQECVALELLAKFPGELEMERIYGEENGKFKVGEKEYDLRKMGAQNETTQMLSEIFNNNFSLAKTISSVVHSTKFAVNLDAAYQEQLKDQTIDLRDVGIIIDPIDGTNEYTTGIISTNRIGGVISTSGIQACVVLIGAFSVKSGQPVVGVNERPFETLAEGVWTSKPVWGVSLGNGFRLNNLPPAPAEGRVVLMSRREESELKAKLEEAYEVKDVAGAGNKLLSVALGVAEAYFFSGNTVYKWDTLAPHAILLSAGGNVVDAKSFLPVDYHSPKSAHLNGIIVARNEKVLGDLERLFRTRVKRSRSEIKEVKPPQAKRQASNATKEMKPPAKRQRSNATKEKAEDKGEEKAAEEKKAEDPEVPNEVPKEAEKKEEEPAEEKPAEAEPQLVDSVAE